MIKVGILFVIFLYFRFMFLVIFFLVRCDFFFILLPILFVPISLLFFCHSYRFCDLDISSHTFEPKCLKNILDLTLAMVKLLPPNNFR